MAFLLLFIFGAWHGLQPDHAAAAAGLASRHRVPGWLAAFRIALGHALALGAVFVLVHLFPALPLARLESGASILGAVCLVALGLILLGRSLRHSEEDHGHSHAIPAVVLGIVLGLSGARSAALMLPLISGPSGAFSALIIYSAGIAAGIVAIGTGADFARRHAGVTGVRLLDATLGVVTVGTGCWLGFGAF